MYSTCMYVSREKDGALKCWHVCAHLACAHMFVMRAARDGKHA